MTYLEKFLIMKIFVACFSPIRCLYREIPLFSDFIMNISKFKILQKRK